MRADEKKTTDDFLEVSNDGMTLFFDRQDLIRFLTGRLLGYASDRSTLVHRLVLGVVEAMGNKAIVQFDMPGDASQMVSLCGLEWGKERKNP